jgi:hypothetical protein
LLEPIAIYLKQSFRQILFGAYTKENKYVDRTFFLIINVSSPYQKQKDIIFPKWRNFADSGHTG